MALFIAGCHGASDNAAHRITVITATRSPDGAHIAVAYSDQVEGEGAACRVCVDAFPLTKPFKDAVARCPASHRSFGCGDPPRLTWRGPAEVAASVAGPPAIEPMLVQGAASLDPSISIVYRRSPGPAPTPSP